MTTMSKLFLPVLFISLLICCNAKQQTVVKVKSMDELQSAIAKVKPGGAIVLLDGEYDGDKTLVKINGTRENPIVIKAESVGKAIVRAGIQIKGDFISLIGIKFSGNGQLQIEGKSNRVSRCFFDDVKTGKWLRILPGSSNIEIDHNIFENKKSNLDFERGCQLMQIVVRNQNEQHHIHHNLFKDIPQGSGNGFETLQLITENNPFDPPPGDCNTIIEDNLFVRCNGESEIISVKSNGNILRRNTFRACRGALVLRHGDDNLVTGNFFFGDGEAGSGGVRLQGTGQVVVNNYFENLGNYGLGMMDGTPDDLYMQVEHAQILFNTFINCNNTFQIGLNHSKHPNGTPPKNSLVAGNIFYADTQEDSNSSDQPFIVFVQNDQPIDWKWNENIFYGNPNQEAFPGLIVKDPAFVFSNQEIVLPSEQTPFSTALPDVDKYLSTDLLNSTRGEKKTLGAIQFTSDPYSILLAQLHRALRQILVLAYFVRFW